MGERYEPKDVLDGLLFLRKYGGLTERRLRQRRAVVAVLGGAAEHYDVLLERFESALYSLSDDDAALLLDVYGLSEESTARPTLDERRVIAGDRLGLTAAGVADRDSKAIERLHYQLMTGWYPKSPTGIRVPESHNGFIQHEANLRVIVRDGRHVETWHRYRLLMLNDDVQFLRVTSALPASTVGEGDFTVRSEELPRGWEHVFWFRGTAMERGKVYSLDYCLHADPAIDRRMTHESLAIHTPTRFLRVEVLFKGQSPARAWQYSGLTQHEFPARPAAGRMLDLVRGTSIEADFRDLHGGLFAGVAWEWG